MKSLLVFFAISFFIISVNAQPIEIPNKNGMIDNIKTVKPQQLKGKPFNFDKGNVYGVIKNSDTLKGILQLKKKSLDRNPGIISDTIPQAKHLYNTDKGKVYALPFDNMPCLVPDEMYSFNYPKNYKQYYPKGYIPNPYSRYDLIPGQLHGKVSGIKISPIPNK